MAARTPEERDRPPGTVRPESFLPRLHYELLVCGLRGHALIGTDAAELRPEDAIFARDMRRLALVPLPALRLVAAARPARLADAAPPARPRGDRAAAARQGAAGQDRAAGDRRRPRVPLRAARAPGDRDLPVHRAPGAAARHLLPRRGRPPEHDGRRAGAVGHVGLLHELDRLFSLRAGTLHLVGAAVAVYAVLEGVEAVGLWYQQRWAEYLTFIATTALLPLEVYELTRTVSPLKIIALIVNIAVVVYLLRAKRLFGFSGGAAAERPSASATWAGRRSSARPPRPVGWPRHGRRPETAAPRRRRRAPPGRGRAATPPGP